jgi:N-hydroxyarylamine O-acetyltransferase
MRAVDLAAYFARIGYTGDTAPTRATLGSIVYRHTLSIPFENVDAFLGRRVSLEPAAVFDKLVHQRRGGWCFEHNLLLGEALRALGFEVTDLAARVLLGRAVDDITPRSHRVLMVDVAGRSWLADVGFGAQLTPTDVLDFGLDTPQPTPHGEYRLVHAGGGERRLEAGASGQWLPMFRFDLHPQRPIDFEASNFQLVHDPASHFTQRLGVSLVTPEGRHGLRGRELVFIDHDDHVARRELETPQLVDALREVFGLELDAGTLAAIAAKIDGMPQGGSAGLAR